MTELETFKPTDATRAIHQRLMLRLGIQSDKEFFEIWEAEGEVNPDAPHRAGSIIADAHLRIATIYGVFGADCAGREASLERWLATAKAVFNDAVKDVAKVKESVDVGDAESGEAVSEDPAPALILPDKMTPAIDEVLGMMNFRTGPIAHFLRGTGDDIPRKCEREQSHVLFWLLKLAIEHGDGWHNEFKKEVDRRAEERIRAQSATSIQ